MALERGAVSYERGTPAWIFRIERLRKNLADSTRNIIKNLYHSRLDGPIACHVLVQNSRSLKIFLVEIGLVFPQPLYLGGFGGGEGGLPQKDKAPSVTPYLNGLGVEV